MKRKELRKEYRLKKKNLKQEYRVQKKETTNKKELRKEYKKNKKLLLTEYVEKINVEYNVDPKKDAPYRVVLEEIGNAVTHGVGSGLSIVAFILMLLKADTSIDIFSSIVYFIGLFILFTMSCLYHSFPYASKVKKVFRRFDYLSIYLLIGATFAPILLSYIGGTLGNIFFLIQWIVIIFGVTMISIFGPGKMKWLHLTLYIILGWCGIIFIPHMISNDFNLFISILGGGVIYTIGIIPFSIDKKVTHFLWHFFVLFGAITQWIGIYLYIF